MNDIPSQPIIFSRAAEWRAWLEQETARFLRGYEQDPRRIASDRGGERSAITAYHGREVLELLQNANDAAAENGTNSRVRIELSQAGLVVANTGRPFQADGIVSLMLAHLSTKKRDGLVIGNKGLGFRAILNWTHRPIVLSGALGLGFGSEFAREHEARIQHILERLPTEQAGGLPILQFPEILDGLPGDLSAEWHEVYATSRRCHDELGFDTAIGVPFDRPGSYQQALEQIESLGPEVLLFVKHLDRLEIALPDVPVREWHIVRIGQEALVESDGATVRTWKVWEDRHSIPSELVEEGSPALYELAIATSDLPPKKSKLFAHFATQVDFSYPVTCHASFELDPARNHLIQSALNLFILRKLAALHAVVVEDVATKDGGWSGGRLAITSRTGELFPGGDYHSELLAALADRPFLPCVDGQMRTPSEARFIPGGAATWLPEQFGDAVNIEGFPSATSLLAALQVRQLTEQEWLERVDALDFTNDDTLAAFIAGAAKSGVLANLTTLPALLTDSQGHRIRGGRVYVAGSSVSGPETPPWLSLRFLKPGLRERLQRLLSATDGRDLAAKLKAHRFDADEYNTASVTGAAVTQAEGFIATNPGQAAQVRHELLQFLFQIFQLRASESDFRPITRLQIPNLKGDWTAAVEAHFSEGHTEHGSILQALYLASHPELLVAAPDAFPWAEDKGALAAFLRWIGVHDLPRGCILPTTPHVFVSLIKGKMPASFHVVGEGGVYTHDSIGYRHHVEAASIVGLEDILTTASPDAILSWVVKDSRWGEWMDDAKTHGAFLFIKPNGSATKKYDGAVPSYPRWLIQRTAWLIADDGAKYAPQEMLLSDDARTSKIIPKPAIASREGLSQESILSALFKVGLSRDITALPPDAYFSALRRSELVDYKAAGGYYRYLIEARKNSADGVLMGSNERRDFIRTGKVWCEFEGGFRLVEVEQARYRRGDDVPKGISKYVPLVYCPPKRGDIRIESLFGVRPLRESGFQIHDPVPRAGSDEVRRKVSEAAESILLYRQASVPPTRGQREAISQLQVFVCATLTATFVAEDSVPKEVEMSANEWILTGSNQALYVVSPEGQQVWLRNECLVNAIAEAIASIFGITDASAFARIIQAENENQRLALLATLLGEAPEDVQEQLAQMRARAEAQARAGGPIPAPLPAAPPPIPAPIEKPAEKPPEAPEPPAAETGIGDDSEVVVTPVDHTPGKRRRIRARVTQASPKEKNFTLHYKGRASGAEAEKVAMAYERNAKRYPVRVNHAQGTEGSGCDILSYDTPEEAQAVRDGSQKAPFENVRRIIEVKGRRDEQAQIALEGNELTAAETRTDRYFLYRIFKAEEPDTWQIAILQNPKACVEAHVPTLVVDLDAAAGTQKAVLTLAEEEGDDDESVEPAAAEPAEAAS